jgi:hypothetical protein
LAWLGSLAARLIEKTRPCASRDVHAAADLDVFELTRAYETPDLVIGQVDPRRELLGGFEALINHAVDIQAIPWSQQAASLGSPPYAHDQQLSPKLLLLSDFLLF